MPRAQRIAVFSLIIGFLVLGLKTLAYSLTGSVALLSEALESIVNVATAATALWAIRMAAMPADDNHHYGHHKAEIISAMTEGVLIILAAIVILWNAIDAFLTPRDWQNVDIGIGLNIAAGLINAIWSSILITQGRAIGSQALIADGVHLRTDVVSSVGVIIGIGAAVWFGLPWLDPLLACVVALHILMSGWQVIRGSLGVLLDEAVDETKLTDIRKLIAQFGTGALQAHDLRTRYDGCFTYVDFHLIVPSDMTVYDAHQLCDQIEAALKAHDPQIKPHIHLEPAHKAEADAIEIETRP